jgi:hypothetical protein
VYPIRPSILYVEHPKDGTCRVFQHNRHRAEVSRTSALRSNAVVRAKRCRSSCGQNFWYTKQDLPPAYLFVFLEYCAMWLSSPRLYYGSDWTRGRLTFCWNMKKRIVGFHLDEELRWLGLSEQRVRLAKWSICRG